MRAKTRKEIAGQYYVNRSDIQILLGIPRRKARDLFEMVDKEERKKRFRAHESKVPLVDVLNAAGVGFSFLMKQIEKD